MVVKVTQEDVEAVVSVILRVPALFLMEGWYRSDFTKTDGTDTDRDLTSAGGYYLALITTGFLLMLPLKRLVMFYMYVISGGLMALAYYHSQLYVQFEMEYSTHGIIPFLSDDPSTGRLILYPLIQCLIAAVAAFLIEITGYGRFTMLIFTGPMIAKICGVPPEDLTLVHQTCTMLLTVMFIFFAFNHVGPALDVVKDGIWKAREAITEFGWIPVIVTFWHTIFLPAQLLLFWIVLLLGNLIINILNPGIFKEGSLVILLVSIGSSCVTPLSLFAMCTMISYSSYYMLTLTKLFLLGWEGHAQDNDLLRGWTEGFTMLLIAAQTGLLDLKPLQKAFLLSILLFIVVSSMIQSMYEVTEPILLSLSAGHSQNKFKNIRAVLLCTFLWMFPLYMSYTICQYFDVDFWLLIIISSCLLTSVQVIGCLLVYWLFMYDAMRLEPWEKLDDVVYYTRSTVRVLEFIVAVSVVCYGAKESIFGEWSWTNSFILLIHFYFNVWQRLQSGWKTFLLRREAVEKLESLLEATDEQLENHNDVCSICFQELKTARVTKCGHFFHGCCLRKWLYVKDSCPMCHQLINEVPKEGKGLGADGVASEEAMDEDNFLEDISIESDTDTDDCDLDNDGSSDISGDNLQDGDVEDEISGNWPNNVPTGNRR